MAKFWRRGGINDYGGRDFYEQARKVGPLGYEMDLLKYENVLAIGSFGLAFTVKCDIHGKVVMKEMYIPPSAKDPNSTSHEYLRTAEFSNLSCLHFARHPNIIKMLGNAHHVADNVRHNFILLECAPTDLRTVMDNCQFSEVHIKTMTRALLSGIRRIHQEKIIHRNIRPDAIYIDSKGIIKISGFGYCYQMDQNLQKVYLGGPQVYDRTPNQQGTLHYRAPELILGLEDHTQAVDIWSIGCIVGEIIVGHKLFEGENDEEQLLQIREDSELFLEKDLELWKTYPRWTEFEKSVGRDSNSYGNVFQMKLSNPLTWNRSGVRFVKSLIAINPETRPKANQTFGNIWFWRKKGEPRGRNLKDLLDQLNKNKFHNCDQQEVQDEWRDFEQDFQEAKDMGEVINIVQRVEMNEDEDDDYMSQC
ncbi:hypothetical protein CAEBREN_00484 [Caenorhabditis brenneri]|uniref:Protein kinase domain-containing protein n=1 Tax=Caenorhabditis brenneri TaxID=135651 RepID=G0MQI5_CAEBE|nr:hypothetical protein CAEBREN_00484 [Caenorhabditis brenneri]